MQIPAARSAPHRATRSGSTSRVKGRASPTIVRCFLTQVEVEKQIAIRLVRSHEGEILPDLNWKLRGTDVVIAPCYTLLVRIAQTEILRQAFGSDIRVRTDLPAITSSRIKERLFSVLSMTRRAGVITIGAENVRRAIVHRKILASAHASTVSPDSLRKLRSSSPNGFDFDSHVLSFVDPGSLGRRFGVPWCVHLALLRSASGLRCLQEIRRWIRFCTSAPPL